MMVEVPLYVERNGEEIELTVKCDVTPIRRGNYWHPDEGGDIDILGIKYGASKWPGILSDQEEEQLHAVVRDYLDE